MPRLNHAEIQTIAERILHDYDRAEPGTQFGEDLRLEIEDAWLVQDVVAQLRIDRGEKDVGYKIGCIVESNQQRMGLTHPASGRLWASEIHEDCITLPKSEFANVALEAEFAVELSEDIEPGRTTDRDLLRAIKAIYPVIEIHNLVLRSEKPHGHELLANNAIHAGVVRGAAITEFDNELATDLALIFDGQTVDSWDSLHWPNDMLAAVNWLVERLAGKGNKLRAGELILTGAFGPPLPLGPGTKADVTSSAFGSVSAVFT